MPTSKNNPPKNSFSELGINERTALIYKTVADQIARAKSEGRLAENENLNIDGVVAQIILESGTGSSELAKTANNFGGLKADKNWQGPKSPSGRYRAFDTPEEGLRAQVDFYLDNPRYRNNGVFNAKTPEEHFQAVQKAGYAEAKNYVDTGLSVVKSIPKRLAKADPNLLMLSNTSTSSANMPSSVNTEQFKINKLPTLPLVNLSERPLMNTEPIIANFVPEASAPNKMPEIAPMVMKAPKGWFGSGQSIFNTGGTMDFKSKGAYQKWLAYGHASGEFAKTPGHQAVSIKGKSHKVEHAMGGNLYAAGGSFNNPGFQALPPAVQAKIRANAQYGGYMYAEGGPMRQLTEFNEGGRHEENPLGGIPQGTAPDGRVNLVEQGETKLDSANYIFSDTLKVDKTAVEQFGLNKSDIGKTFAEVSKKLNRPNSRRENDTIEQEAIKKDLDNLMQAQEEFKQRDLEKDMAMMMQKHPEAMEALMQQQSVQPMGMPQGQPVDASQLPPEALAQMPEAQQGAPIMAYGGGMYKCGGNMYNLGGNMYENGGEPPVRKPYKDDAGNINPREGYAPGNTPIPSLWGKDTSAMSDDDFLDTTQFDLYDKGAPMSEAFWQDNYDNWKVPTTQVPSITLYKGKNQNKIAYQGNRPNIINASYPSPYIGAQPLKNQGLDSYEEKDQYLESIKQGPSMAESYPLYYQLLKDRGNYQMLQGGNGIEGINKLNSRKLGGRMYEGGGGFQGDQNNNGTLDYLEQYNMIMGAPQGTANDQGFRDLSGGTGGMIQGTAAGGAPTTSIEQAGGKDENAGGGIGGNLGKAAIGSLAGMGTAYGASKMQEQAQSATANQNSGTAAGIKSGVTSAVSMINPVVGGLIGLGQGIGNEQRMKYEAVDPQTGELQNQKKAEEGYVLGHFFDPIGSAIEDWSNPNLNFGQKLASTLGFSALVRKDYAKGLEKQAKENLGIKPEIEFKKRGAAAETSAMYSGYEDALEQQRQQNPYAQQAKYGGYQAQVPYHNYPAIYPTYPHNAGPMGMGLGTNLYPLGGPLDGDPVKTTTGKEVTVTPVPPIASLDFTLPEDYGKIYNQSVIEFRNNPKNEQGIPSHGGSYRLATDAERKAKIAELAARKGDLNIKDRETYQVLINNLPFYVDEFDPTGHYVHAGYDLRKLLANKPAPPPPPDFSGISKLPTKPATQVDTRNISGEVIPYKQGKQYNAETGKWETSFALNPSTPLAQQTQAAEDFRLKNLAYQNQQLAERGAAPMMDTSTHAPVGEQMNPLIEQYLVNKAKVNSPEPTNTGGWQREGLGFAMGGHMYEDGGKKLNRNKILNTLSYLPQDSVNTGYTFPEEPMPFTFTTPTYTDVNVWGEQPPQVVFSNNLPKMPMTFTTPTGSSNIDVTNEELNLVENLPNQSTDLTFDEYNNADYKVNPAVKKEEEEAKRKKQEEKNKKNNQFSDVDTKLDEGKSQFNYNQSLGNWLLKAGPIAYNAYQGLFGKVVDTPEAEELMGKVGTYRMNIQPQVNAVQQSYAALQNSLGNASMSPGAYLSNMQVAANNRNAALAELYTQKQNMDAQNQLRAEMFNAQQKGPAAEKAFNLKMAAQAAKQNYLQQALNQAFQLGSSDTANELAGIYNSMAAPDFGFNYTPFIKGKLKEAKDKKAQEEKNNNKKK